MSPDASLSTDHLLDVRGLRAYFFTPSGVVKAVDDVSFRIAAGEVLGLVGESGCGKSITSLSLMRLVPAPGRIVGGEILFEGKDLLTLPESGMRALRGSRMGMVFQEPASALNPVFTIGYQVGESLMIHRGLTRKQAMKEAEGMLEEVAIPDPGRRVREYPHQLSGGMRQRVMIAMALICKPSLLIADEPTTALDVTIQAQILDLLRRLREKYSLTVLLISHDLGVVAQMADRVAVMYAGKIVEEAGVDDLFRSPLHPYTVGLMKSIPGNGPGGAAAPGRKLYAIEGMVPDLRHLPRGCSFNPRCCDVMPRCHDVHPALVRPAVGTGGASRPRRVSCFKYEPEPDPAPPVEGRGWNAASGR
ncbi:MAG: ABC transporter ATP-binding protein [Acidobacteriota bacterium]